jgi:hypothetical protein
MTRSGRSTPWDKLVFDRPPVPSRSCSPCTDCCTWGPPLGGPKPDQDACVQVCATGCSVYADRPVSPCRLFRCAWLQNEGLLRNEDRPDLLGVIVGKHEFRPDYCVRGAETVFEVWVRAAELLQDERVQEVMEELAQFGPVVARGNGWARLASLPTKPLVTPGLDEWMRQYVAKLDVGVLR